MGIDVQPYIDQLDRLNEYFAYRMRRIALNEWTIYRIIFDKAPERTISKSIFKPSVINPNFISDPYIELTTERWHEHPNRGWGTKPDERMHMIGQDIEAWQLHKNEPILTFEQWINSTS